MSFDLIVAITKVISLIAVFLLFGAAMDYELKHRESTGMFLLIGITAGAIIWLIVN